MRLHIFACNRNCADFHPIFVKNFRATATVWENSESYDVASLLALIGRFSTYTPFLFAFPPRWISDIPLPCKFYRDTVTIQQTRRSPWQSMVMKLKQELNTTVDYRVVFHLEPRFYSSAARHMATRSVKSLRMVSFE